MAQHGPQSDRYRQPAVGETAGEYKILYEMERRLDDKFNEARRQNKEDIASALGPVTQQLVVMSGRLDTGSRRMKDMEEDMDRKFAALGSGDTTALIRKGSSGWISVDKIPMLLTAVGVLFSGIISSIALMRSPAPPSEQTSPTPTHKTPPGE